MSDPTPPENSEPVTGPVLTPPQASPVYDTGAPPEPEVRTVDVQQPPSRLNKAAAWVGIAAGSVFIVAVIFGTGFIVGKHAGGHGGGHDRGQEMVLRPGPGMFPMGPPGQFGPGGPVIEIPRAPGGPGAPGGAETTPAPPRP